MIYHWQKDLSEGNTSSYTQLLSCRNLLLQVKLLTLLQLLQVHILRLILKERRSRICYTMYKIKISDNQHARWAKVITQFFHFSQVENTQNLRYICQGFWLDDSLPLWEFKGRIMHYHFLQRMLCAFNIIFP